MFAAPLSRHGRLIAAAAVLVTAPRLVMTFLSADGIVVPARLRIVLLTLTSVATSIALTGGIAYLSLAIVRELRNRAALVAIWAAALLCSSALIAPGIAATLPSSTLATVLPGRWQQWAWSICAVAAVDLIAAGAMRADALHGTAALEAQEALSRIVAELEKQRDSARAELKVAREELQRLPSRRTPTAAPATPPLCSCGRLFSSRQALVAHQRWCRPRSTAAAPGARERPGAGATPLPPGP